MIGSRRGILSHPGARRRHANARLRRTGRPPVRALAAIVGVVAVLLAMPTVPVLAAGDATLKIVPSSATPEAGQPFTVEIVQNASVATTGAQADVVFDQALVQLVDMKPGEAYAKGLFLFGTADDGSNKSPAAAMAKANETGTLKNLATFLLPGSGSVPPGDAVVATLTFAPRGGPGGALTLKLDKTSMLDESGNVIAPTTTDATVTVAAGAAASTGPSAAPSAQASAEPTGSAVPAPSAGTAEVTADPEKLETTAGVGSTIALTVNSASDVSAVNVDLAFDPKVVEITGLQVFDAWGKATILAGGAGQSVDDAIAEANRTGVLRQVGAVLLPGTGTFPSGATTFLVVGVMGRVDGSSELTLSDAKVLDGSGVVIPVAGTAGQGGSTGANAGPGPQVLLVPLAILAAIVLLVLLLRSDVIPARTKRRWPQLLAILSGLIPLAMLIGLVVVLVVRAAPVVRDPGIGALLADTYSNQFSLAAGVSSWGLVPAVWGTVLIALIAIVLAVPVALAMAIIAAEFPLGPLGRFVRPLLGVLSGIPPIVYPIAGAIFVTVFMAPKFAGSATYSSFRSENLGVPYWFWPPPDVPFGTNAYPWPPNVGGIPNSTLLGAVLVALLVVPFMTPLILDAMRNVPSAAREASFALGANRTYTLRRIILPQAMPGLVAAVALALLKAFGDVLIVGLAVGWTASKMPAPWVDPFERTPTLAASGASIVGDLLNQNASGCNPNGPACGVGYSAALVLLVVAAVIVLVAGTIETRWRRRLAV